MTDFENDKQDNKTNSPTDQAQSPQGENTGGQNDKSNNELADKVSSVLQGDTKAVKDIYNQAKDSAGKAYGIATEKAASKIDEQKTYIAQGLSGVADTIRQLGDNLDNTEQSGGFAEATANYTNTVADKVEQISGYIEKKDLREVMSDVEEFAHRQPLLFLGGAFALGVLAARFLKSSNSNQTLTRRPRNTRKGLDSASQSESKYLPDDLDEQMKLNREGVHLPADLDEQIRSKNQQENLTAETPNTGDNLWAQAAK